MVVGGVPAHEDRQEAQQSWRTPDDCQHDHEASLRHDQRVVQGLNYSVVPVHTRQQHTRYGMYNI